jgi:hypothetical protein
LQEAVVDAKGDVVAGWLLHTELHCAARCHPDAVRADAVGQLLDAVILVDLTRGDLMTAGSLPWGLRSYDAIHLAVALRVGADAMIGLRRRAIGGFRRGRSRGGAAALAVSHPRVRIASVGRCRTPVPAVVVETSEWPGMHAANRPLRHGRRFAARCGEVE